jgi:4'-phosphopantetheinyl transferase
MTPKILFPPPPQNLEPVNGDIHVFCAPLDPPPARMERLAGLLSEGERARASRFTYEQDRNRFVAGRGVLREILGWLLHANPETLRFSHNSHGKPQLAPATAEGHLHFNLAHSGSLAVFAVSRAHEVGIDVEQIRPICEAEDIASHCFSKRERAQWHSFPAGRKTEAFFNCWVRKEAWQKAHGEGISERLDQIEVFFSGDLSDGAQNSVRSLPLALDYTAAVAAKGRIAGVDCWKWQKTVEQ